MNKNATKRIVYIAVYTALALVLDFIKEAIPFLNMPQGGSINLAYIPVALASFHLGIKGGLSTGILWWLISSILGLNSHFINIIQYSLDYIVPTIVLGASSFLYKHKNIYEVESGLLITNLIKTLSVVLSGVYYWPGDAAAGSKAAWIASLSYNLPYSIATMLVLMIVIPILLKRFDKFFSRI